MIKCENDIPKTSERKSVAIRKKTTEQAKEKKACC